MLGPRDIVLSGIKEAVASDVRLPITTYGTGLLGLLSNPSVFKSSVSRGLSGAIAQGHKKHYEKLLGPKPQHASAEAVRRAIPDLWHRGHKFAVVRNPWDRMVSDYYWMTKNRSPRPKFGDWLSALASSENKRRFHSNIDQYAIDDELVLNQYLRFENLQRDLEVCLSQIGLTPTSGLLPNLKSGLRPAGPYRDYYDRSRRAVVAELFAAEIESFGYSFE